MADEVTSEQPAAVLAPSAPAATEPTQAAPVASTEIEAPSATEKDDAIVSNNQPATEVNATSGGSAAAAGTAGDATAPPSTIVDNTPNSSKKRSTAGVPEHKKNKGKRKSMPVLHLDCKPGEFYWARLKGFPPWPSVICDEQMLPEVLLGMRPVSAARPDGSVREDFLEGGKNAKDRTFPIMFLSTNEFAWMNNTSLTPLDPKECETLPSGKVGVALQKAYEIAAEGHDLDYFKNLLKVWQEEQAQAEQELREFEEEQARAKEAKQAAAEAAKAKKKNRKSKGGDTDVEMEDADAPKSSKKRKKEAESDADGAKPKKTPKVTKINAPKTPNGEASASKKAAKPKKKVVVAPKEEEEEKPQMTEEERLAQREKAVLYLRHRLQKGFLSRDQAPQEAEMAAMADFFKQLETYENLEPAIIRNTKIHKVLKAIVKLSSIPKDEEYNFKKRSAAMLEIWNRRMESDGGAAPAVAAEPKAVAEPAQPAPHVNGDAVATSEIPKAEAAAPTSVVEPSVEKSDSTVAPAIEKADAVVAPPTAPVEVSGLAQAAAPSNDAAETSTEAKPAPVEAPSDVPPTATSEQI